MTFSSRIIVVKRYFRIFVIGRINGPFISSFFFFLFFLFFFAQDVQCCDKTGQKIFNMFLFHT